MPARQVQFIDVGSGESSRSIAVMHQPAEPTATQKSTAPGVIWLQGFKSEMTSLKATALAQWSASRSNPFTRFDYSGHGQSSGRFEDGTIGDWLEDSLAVFEAFTTGPQVVVGSSMGGWLALLLVRKLLAASEAKHARIKALVLIAPAWDMTEDLMWHQASDTIRDEILRNGVYMRPSAYDDEPYPITLKLIEEGRTHLIRQTPFDPGVPIRIMHGALDPDVPLSHSLELQRLLHGDHVAITQVPDGEHRLSRPQDLDLLMSLIEEVSQD